MWEKLSSLEHHSPERLAARRRRGHYRVLLVQALLLCILFAAFLYGIWQSPVRISHVTVYGGEQKIAQIALTSMQGSYLGLIPFDSTFFLSEGKIRAAIIAAYPDIAAISIFRNGLDGISIKVNTRVPVARWCGASPTNLTGTSTAALGISECYPFDALGVLYVSEGMVTPLNSFVVYEPLTGAGATTAPVGTILPNANAFPAVFDFARQLATFGSPVTAVVFRGDEVDDYLKSGTRVTYVLGNEQYAMTALTSAKSKMNLANGSLDYVDLRFDGKVYLKKK